MNLCLFFEGTGQGVAGRITNVTRIRDLCVDNAGQKLHLEPGLGILRGRTPRADVGWVAAGGAVSAFAKMCECMV